MFAFRPLRVAALVAVATAMSSAAWAAPAPGGARPASGPALVEKAQVGIYIGIGEPRPYYRPYAPYDRPYDRPYYGYRSYYYGPPPASYYESRPYVALPPVPVGPYGDPDALALCASRFRSFNANTGTYVTYDGEERLCPYLR